MLERKRGKVKVKFLKIIISEKLRYFYQIIFMSSKAGVVPTPYLAVHSGIIHILGSLA